MGKKAKSQSDKASAEATIQSIRRKTRRKHSAEEKIRIVIEGLRGDDTIAELCRREGIAQSLYYKCVCRQNFSDTRSEEIKETSSTFLPHSSRLLQVGSSSVL